MFRLQYSGEGATHTFADDARESLFRHCTNDLPVAQLLKYWKRTR